MTDTIKKELLNQAQDLLSYLDTLTPQDSVLFTDKEVQAILQDEHDKTQANYDFALKKFIEGNSDISFPKEKIFAVYWGYPGAGKSVMTQKIIDRFSQQEDCLPFNIIDKDDHRDLFPNLFEHLKGGHIDECEKFADVSIEYVRTILELSLHIGKRSVLSVGSMGAGSEFKDNALEALKYGYRPCAIYMAINKDIAYLSNIYRSAMIYDQIIFQNKQLYPRLVSGEYFKRVVKMLPQMLDNIDCFQKENSQRVDFMVINRNNKLLYHSNNPQNISVKEIVRNEEERPLNGEEAVNIHMQLFKIRQNLQYRCENNIYTPCKSEVEAIRFAVSHIYDLISQKYHIKPYERPQAYFVSMPLKSSNFYLG